MKTAYQIIALSFLCSILVIGKCHAESLLQDKVTAAIVKFESTPRERWAFKVSRYENEEGDITSSIETFDPERKKESLWSLVQINGDAPSEAQIRRFLTQKQERSEQNEGNEFTIKLRELIQLDSLSLSSEDEQSITLAFDVNLERLGNEASEKLQGLLSLNKQRQFIEAIEIVNTEPFSPMFSAKITDFNLQMRFIEIDGAVLPFEQELTMQGKFAFFTEINEHSLDTFSNYKFRPLLGAE